MTDEFEYNNGADGSCQECGADTDEEWYAYCADCFAEQSGWHRPSRAALRWQHEDRQQLTLADVIARLDQLEVTIRWLQADREASGSEAAR